MTRGQRLGIVVSIAWALGAGWWQRASDVERAVGHDSLPQIGYRLCELGNDEFRANAKELGIGLNVGQQDCMKFVAPDEMAKSLRIWAPWSQTLATALLPIPIGWLLVWLVVRIARWVLGGSNG